MKISTKARYGLRILIDIALNGDDRPRMIREISVSQGISQKYIGRLILELRKAGFLRSVRGAKGGYVLKKNPKDISLLEIMEVMEGQIHLTKCLLCPTDCKRAVSCSSRSLWSNLTEEMRLTFARVNLAEIVFNESLDKSRRVKAEFPSNSN